MDHPASRAVRGASQSAIDSGLSTSQVKHRFSKIPRIPSVAKSDLGTKRICPTTGKKFYDLNKSPVISPYTGEVVPIAPIAPPRTRADAAARAAAASAAAETPEVAESEELVSLEEADAEENSGKKAAVLESEDDIEVDETIDDDEDDDSTFIADEEEGDEDVTDIIGDVSGDEES
jgi:uncharacterized protein (TIGR02300 family)